MAPVRSGRFSGGDFSLEYVDEFCCLGNLISIGGGVVASLLDWKKFRESSPFLTMKGLFLFAKGELYRVCVRCAVLRGNGGWATKTDEAGRL